MAMPTNMSGEMRANRERGRVILMLFVLLAFLAFLVEQAKHEKLYLQS